MVCSKRNTHQRDRKATERRGSLSVHGIRYAAQMIKSVAKLNLIFIRLCSVSTECVDAKNRASLGSFFTFLLPVNGSDVYPILCNSDSCSRSWLHLFCILFLQEVPKYGLQFLSHSIFVCDQNTTINNDRKTSRHLLLHTSRVATSDNQRSV